MYIERLTTNELKKIILEQGTMLIDTRQSDAYNGWAINVSKGGHIQGAVDFSCKWLSVEIDKKEYTLEMTLSRKMITIEKNLVLYDSNDKDAIAVGKFLKEKGYKNLYYYNINDWIDEGLDLVSYRNYHMLVPPQILKSLIDGKMVETFENINSYKIIDIAWGDYVTEYKYDNGHIPGAFYINTDVFEPPPEWMLLPDHELIEFALKYGFKTDDTIIITSYNSSAACRLGVVLKYIGIKDVRILNGGITEWIRMGYDLETTQNILKPSNNMNWKKIINQDIIVKTIDIENEIINNEKFTLVDVRSKDEYYGKSTGYSYHNIIGRIPGSVFGNGGSEGYYPLQGYRNIDNTMRNGYEILTMWENLGIDISKRLAFMCGSGWRASEVLIYAWIMGLDNKVLYSDGWIGYCNYKDLYNK